MSGVDPERLLTAAQCDELLRRVLSFARGGGQTMVRATSWWQGELRWGRNRVNLSSDRRDISLTIYRRIANGSLGIVVTNQLDDASLQFATAAAERKSRLDAEAGLGYGHFPKLPEYKPYTEGKIWSDATYDLTVEERAAAARSMIAPAEKKGLLSAGYLEVRGATMATLGDDFPELRSGPLAYWHMPFTRWTHAYCSTTVRDATGSGSGWAGLSSYDWNAIETAALGERALEKCLASRNPVAIEPGRYTVILEPQAVADLMEVLVPSLQQREPPEGGNPSPWRLGFDDALGLWRSKLGLKVVDERITIEHDPSDPRLGILMSPTELPGPVKWIENGVLTNLGHFFSTDIVKLEGRYRLRGPTGYRMSGGTTSIDEMIATTRRGLLVTRFSNIRLLDGESLL
ncbi:MAG TPA: metallopeptidase TldD-related protein, partial [Steroidobacteraceae bacterium]